MLNSNSKSRKQNRKKFSTKTVARVLTTRIPINYNARCRRFTTALSDNSMLCEPIFTRPQIRSYRNTSTQQAFASQRTRSSKRTGKDSRAIKVTHITHDCVHAQFIWCVLSYGLYVCVLFPFTLHVTGSKSLQVAFDEVVRSSQSSQTAA